MTTDQLMSRVSAQEEALQRPSSIANHKGTSWSASSSGLGPNPFDSPMTDLINLLKL